MECVVCRQDNDRVVDSRLSGNGGAIRRRRECLSCGHRFTTYERPELSLRVVIKKDGRREPFDREKLLRSMQIACQKRQIATGQLIQSAERIESDLFGDCDCEASSRTIGELVIEELKSLDTVAYVRFASVYKQFADVLDFAQALLPLMPQDAQVKIFQRANGEWRNDSPMKEIRNGNHPGGS